MKLSIREAGAQDAESCSLVLCASIRDLCTQDHNGDAELIAHWTANKTPANLARWIANPRVAVFLAEHDGVPACVGSISDDGEVLLNYVAPSHRFAGISKAMLTHLEAALRRRGIAKARLTSTTTAHRFYLEAGWADAGRPEVTFGIKGFPMEKAL